MVESFYDSERIIAKLDSGELCADLTDLHNNAKLQQECNYRDLYAYIDKSVLPEDPQRCRKILATAEFYDICNSVLYHWGQRRANQVTSEQTLLRPIALPKVLRQSASIAYHDNTTHFEIERVIAALKQKFHWEFLHQDIYDSIHSCDRCQRIKVDKRQKYTPLNIFPRTQLLTDETFFFK